MCVGEHPKVSIVSLRKRSSRYSSVNAYLLSAETKHQHHSKDYRDIRQILSPHPLILCQITRLNGTKRLDVLNLQSPVAKDRNKEQVDG